MALSTIEWTEASWNPVTGCTKISPGCAHCYAERMAARLKGMGQPNYQHGFRVTLQPQTLGMPLLWRKPRTVFVNSMSDVFHEDVPFDFVHGIFETMEKASWHTFQLLTKRPERLLEFAREANWPDNVWAGVSVENRAYLPRLDHLREVPAAVRFVSFEPLLGSLGEINLSGIDWVIVGGESGPGARPMERSWVVEIRDQCRACGVPFFFKQWGGARKRASGRLLDGRTWDQMPPELAGRPRLSEWRAK
ncbi:MAG: phage Gp37/Gp68 family protein [Bacillota bacterium]|nr:phage Gp37/Gp68 family protein [Bacillota bacterium]